MSHTRPTASSSSNFQSVFNAALKAYKKKTKSDLLAHPLATQLEKCDSTTDILAVLQDQVHKFDHQRSADQKLTKWLNPTVNVLYAFSATLGDGVGLVNLKSPFLYYLCSDLYFAGILARESDLHGYRRSPLGENLPSSLCVVHCDTEFGQAAKGVEKSQDVLVDLFEHVENFFKRLESYTEMWPTDAMTDIIVKVMVEVLSILAIATKEIKQGRASELFTRRHVTVD
jgi:hypothetical protein